jgi:hypothetical protein
VSLAEIRLNLVKGLRPRWAEIEQALYTRILDSVSGPVSRNDLECHTGVRVAVTALVGYSLEAESLSAPLFSQVQEYGRGRVQIQIDCRPSH